MAPVVEVSDAGHCRSLLVELNEQRLRGQFCDVTIIAEDTKFRAHKNVLAASSPFFKQALAEEPACPTPAQVLELPGVQAGVFSDVLNFIYNSRLAVPSQAAARELGAVGRRLGISCLQGLEAGTPKEMNGSWTPPVTGDPRSPAAPVDLTCPPRASETPTVAEPVTSASASSSASLRCGLCGRGFSTAAALGLHAKLHRGRRGLACRHCGKSFIHVKRLQTHEVLCKDGHRDADAAAAAAAAANAAAPPLKQGKKALLLRHRALELIPEQEPVVKVVDGHVVYLCGVCQRSYMTLSSLKRHANVHSWRRKYPCRYCDKVFALAEYRTKHEVWHTGERRYQCIFCWETFVTYYNLKTHQKAFHGINPGLISSEKTPNGGYKPKLNALKLYRLLPMRAHKRPYKTYSQGLVADGILLPTANPVEPSATVGAFPSPRPEPASVIAYGRPSASVIVHSGAAAASVIAYNGRAGEAAAVPAAVPATATAARPMKKQVLRDYIEAQRAAGEAPAGDGGTAPTTQPSPAAATGGTAVAAAGRTMTYVAKPAYVGTAGESRAAPLCQITVRIGEEAIVKRRISETDLRLETTGTGTAASPTAHRRTAAAAAACSRRSGDDDSDAEDRLWRPYYTYKPKRKTTGGGTTGGTTGGGTTGAVKAKKSRWRRKLRSLRWSTGDDDEGDGDAQSGDGHRRRDWQHPCRVCGKTFTALRKLRKHQRGHEGTSGGGGGVGTTAPPTPRVGRRPSLRFACSRCAKVCKTAAALSRHAKRHQAESPPPSPPTVIAYTPPTVAAAAVKEEGGGEKGGVPLPPPPGDDVTAPPPVPGDGGDDVAVTGDEGVSPSPGPSGGYPVQEQPLALLRRGGDPETGGGGGGGQRGGPLPPHPHAPPPTFPLSFGPRLVAAYPYPFPLPLALSVVLPENEGFLGGGRGGCPPSPLPTPHF
ncbi:zinc finger and BTB domain-containing protein 4 [Grus americana]|uniref:zinc finger and BTB domain-containing protein 4 n=1 Tax=Grus americana TaxID=9117 RepID=UPI00240836FD|nr:zinc finger and BTB domain-containing protein 4 [Grus americana]XP_054662743.1 zinc finger and BTB domain-containing protein 4 [Grus americana]XP_054662744.1 zinc finger and BTB domain-containing protein 4 [Grus americana]XP_054662746.1 zinc finger and BTB domain-containing protein 4 [Grus americana]